MARLIIPALLTLAFANGQDLTTEYVADKAFRIEIESRFNIETVDFSMERDGEPVEGGFGGGPTIDETRTFAMVDTVKAVEDGQPTHVRRKFETIEGSSFSVMGDRENESNSECPLSGTVIDVTVDGEDVITEMVEGSEPDDEKCMEGHAPALALDGLLPSSEVEAGESWELDGEAIQRALGFDLEHAYFPPPVREEAEEGGRGGRGGRGRGGRGGGGGAARFFQAGEWEGEATLLEGTKEHEGVECHVIEITAEASGELPERERTGGGGGRGGRSLGLPSARPENSFEIELEATLYFSVADKRPMRFEAEAELSAESVVEMQRRDSQMVMSSAQEGTLKYTVDVTSADTEESDE